MLGTTSSILVIVFHAEVTRLIPLYAVGVFTSFTFSQSGMVRRWWRSERSKQRTVGLALSGGGIALPLLHLVILVVAFGAIARLSLRRFA